MVEIPLYRLGASGDRHTVGQAQERGAHSAHDLYRARAELANLVEGKRKVILPGRHRHDEAQHPICVPGKANIEIMPTEATQEILDLVEGLNCRGWIVDRGRERLDGDVDQEANGVFRVLLERAL